MNVHAPYNVNEWGQMLSHSKKKSFERFMRGTDPNLNCFPDLAFAYNSA